MKALRPLLLLTALAASGCGVLDLQDDAREQYEKHRDRWESRSISSYAFSVERICFCGPEHRGPVRVTVENGTVTSRVYTTSGEAVSAELASQFPSIDGLFDIIEDALDRGYHDIEVYYDPSNGVPFNFWVDFDENTVDEEIGFTVDLPIETLGTS